MRTYSDVIIVGAGASGLLCAGILAQKSIKKRDGTLLSITVLDKNDKIGKKLAATGNGRCNFTNLDMSVEHYYGNKEWIEKVLHQVTPERVIDYFSQMGVYARERDGYVYPHTNQAATVVRSLQQLCESNGLQIELACMVKRVHKKSRKNGFELVTSKGVIQCQYLVMATGSAAGKEAGGDDSGYELVKRLGLSVEKIYPALTGLRCPAKWWKRVAGTRIQGRFSLMTGDGFYKGEKGEIQIVKDGVSGIPVFQICRVAAKVLEEGKNVCGVIDFVPDMSEEDLCAWKDRHGIQGLVPEKWINILQQDPGISLKHYTFPVSDTFGLERAQVAAGGVGIDQIDAGTMKVKGISNLYILGELLDVDGRCGGYNLHLAWATAMLAAHSIVQSLA